MVERYKLELGQAIKRRREEQGLTQKALAERTHYKEAQTVSRWERGENLPSNLDAVAEALGWTLAEMVAGIEPPNRRVARKLGMVPDGTPDLVVTLNGSEPTQLDRIEALLNRLAASLLEETVSEMEAAEQHDEASKPTRVPQSQRRR